MEGLKLVLPSREYCDQIVSYRQEFIDNGDSMDGTSSLRKYEDPQQWLQWTEKMSCKETCKDTWVPDIQFLCIREKDNRVVGMVDIRRELNEYCHKYGGHIGYSIRKSERGKGYSKIQLKLALEKAREMGLGRVLITCTSSNEPSRRTILSKGGVFDGQAINKDEGETMERYWIDLRKFFMESQRLGFSEWNRNDLSLAEALWGNSEVTHYICATGSFSREDILNRLETEISNGDKYNIQYWPVFALDSGEFVGCCGLRPFKDQKNAYEMGSHLRKEAWGKGYGTEGTKAVIKYAFESLGAKVIYAGHHPENKASRKLLLKLGFTYIGDNYYEPTGLYHPSYEMKKKEGVIMETERVILRNFEEKDLRDLHEYCSQEGVGEMAGWRHHENMESSEKVLKCNIENKDKYAIELKENHKVIGHIAIDEDSEEGRADTKELGFALNKNYQGKGIMSEVVKEILKYLFSRGDIENVYACCFQENKASKALIEKCGFTLAQEGTFYSESLDKTFKSYEYLYERKNWKDR